MNVNFCVRSSPNEKFLGLGLVLVSALCNGTFALPPKFVRNWAWENTWGTFFLLTLLVFPAAVIFASVHGVADTWREIAPIYLAGTIAFGFLWGCGIIGFGIGVTLVGLSLGFSIIISLSALLGSLVPLVAQHPADLFTPAGLVITLGVLVCVAGIAACGRAGVLREHGMSAAAAAVPAAPGTLLKGLLVCVVAGVCSSGSNIAFSYGQVVKEVSQVRFGNPPWLATLPVWMLVFVGAFAACGSYAVYLLAKNGTWRNFGNTDARRNLALAAVMAVLHFATLFAYGVGAHYLGRLGTSVGYASAMSCSLLVANAMGFLTHEWKGTDRQTRQWLFGGLTLLVLGIVTFTVGNNLHKPESAAEPPVPPVVAPGTLSAAAGEGGSRQRPTAVEHRPVPARLEERHPSWARVQRVLSSANRCSCRVFHRNMHATYGHDGSPCWVAAAGRDRRKS